MDSRLVILGIPVTTGPGADSQELAEATQRLRRELLNLDGGAAETPRLVMLHREPEGWARRMSAFCCAVAFPAADPVVAAARARLAPSRQPPSVAARSIRLASHTILDQTSERGGRAMGNYDREPLDEAEEVRGVFYGSYGQVGQQFVVTNRRLLLAPIKLIKGLSDKVALDVTAFIAGQLNVPGADLVKSILQDYAAFQPHTIWLRHIVNVYPGANGGWLSPPSLVLVTDTEDQETLHITSRGLFTLSGDPRNKKARDDMVAVLQAAALEAKSAPTPDAS
jgi:hypothetical protein